MIDFVSQWFPSVDTDNAASRKKLRLFSLMFWKLWKKCNRSKNRFLTVNSTWLSGNVVFKIKQTVVEKPTLKPFSELGRRSKQTRLHDLTNNHSPEELGMASALCVSRCGFRSVGKRIESLVRSPESATESFENVPQIEEYTAEEAIAFICRNNFSKRQYHDIRMTTLNRGVHLYPSYNKVLLAKQDSYPNGKYYSIFLIFIENLDANFIVL